MATRGFIFRRAADGSMLGVFHNYDSYPSWLGNALLLHILDADGDIAKVAREVVDDMRNGWKILGTPSDHPEPPRDDPEGLEGWEDYIYILDPLARQLTVRGADGDVRRIRIDQKGHGSPPLFESPLYDPGELMVLDGLEGDTETALAARRGIDRELERLGVDRRGLHAAMLRRLQVVLEGLSWGLPPPLETDVERRLGERLGRSPPPDHGYRLSENVYVGPGISWDDHPRLWSLPVGNHELRLPCPQTARRCLRNQPSVVYRSDRSSAIIPEPGRLFSENSDASSFRVAVNRYVDDGEASDLLVEIHDWFWFHWLCGSAHER